jgi:hypothetical protein
MDQQEKRWRDQLQYPGNGILYPTFVMKEGVEEINLGSFALKEVSHTSRTTGLLVSAVLKYFAENLAESVASRRPSLKKTLVRPHMASYRNILI